MSTDTRRIWLIGATWGWGEGKLRVGGWISPRQMAEARRPGQAFFPHGEWWVSCFSYWSGRAEDALLAVEEHKSWIWIFFHVCCVSPHLWQDSVLNISSLWLLSSPGDLKLCYERQPTAARETLSCLFDPFGSKHPLSACWKCRISSPTQNKWI